MLILAIESSAKAASAALCRDGEILAYSYQRTALTHSATLLPMIDDMLKNSGTDKSGIDAVAVARGPGSFTGVRIGVATAKGLCWGLDKPAVGVSTVFQPIKMSPLLKAALFSAAVTASPAFSEAATRWEGMTSFPLGKRIVCQALRS